jgi:uncharacterized protein (TIGR00297 family)
VTDVAVRPGLSAELGRKSLHVAMGGFALLLRWLTPGQAVLCALAALLFNLFLLQRLTRGRFLRVTERERGRSLGMVLYPAAVLALLLVFHERLELAAAAWGLLAFGDGMATVAGVTLGGPRLPWNRGKSWSGFLAFVLWGTAASAFLLWWAQRAALDPGGADWIGASFVEGGGASLPLVGGCLLAAAAAAVAESMRTGIDDNALVPLVGGASLYAATLVEPARWAEAVVSRGDDLAAGLAVNVGLALLAYAARGVTVSGAVWGTVVGTLLYALAGWRGFLMLLVFFAVGTAVTRAGYARKAALGIAQEKGGRRGARHAFANAGAGVLFAALAVATPQGPLFTLALVAAFATALADTTGSEIGQAYGRTPYLVTTFRRVPPGTDGAVSAEGTIAGVLTSALLAAIAWGVGLVTPLGAAIVVLAAFVGTTLESYLGATLERDAEVDNEVVNFANTLAGGAAALLLGSWWT